MPLESGLGGVSNSDGELNLNLRGNEQHTDQVPATLGADEDFTGASWIDTEQIGNSIYLIAGTEAFDTVELEWSDDGASANGTVTDITNNPVTSPIAYNVYLSILNTFTSGRYFRAHIINGPDEQTPPPVLVGICSTGKYPYSPLIGVEDDISLILEAILTRSIQAGKDPDDNFVNLRVSGRDSENSTTTLLTSSQTYRGTWFEWQGAYVTLISDFKADVAGTFYVDFSEDETPTDGDDTSIDASITIAYNPSEGLVRRISPVQSRWVRHRYVNGGTGQADFNLDAAFSTTAPPLVMEGLRLDINESSLAGLVRSVLSASNGSSYANIGRGANGGLDIGIVEHEVETPIKSLGSWTASSHSVTTTAAQLDTSALTNRRTVSVKASSANNKRIFVGPTSAVSVSGGYALTAGSSIEMDLTTASEIWAIADSSTQLAHMIQVAT